nr:XRE family transcriptional regulator [Kineosporia babensis]
MASTIQAVRAERDLSVAALASSSGVSRAMIGKIERGEVQPTAALLAKLAVAFGITLSGLLARVEGQHERVARRADQPVWKDPEQGYLRRAVSPPAASSIELVEAELPPGAEVTYQPEIFRLADQQIWMLSGHLRFIEGEQVHELDAGDCLQLGPPAVCTFVNPGESPCRYLVVLNKSGR